MGDGYWEVFKAAGGNTIRLYDTTAIRNKLDLADSLGLMVAVDIPIPRYSANHSPYDDPDQMQEYTANIIELVTTNREHPALLFWSLGNEVHHPDPFKGQEFFSQFNEINININCEFKGNIIYLSY